LHWGIGHASRCIPIAKAFEELGWEVTLASDGAALDLLRISLPHLKILEMPALEIRYSSEPFSSLGNFSLVPRLMRHINKDHKWLQRLTQKHRFDLIISDHRLGAWHPSIPSILVAHQLNIPFAPHLQFLNRFHHRLLKPFSEVWIPDAPGGTLSGSLSALPSAPLRFWNMGLLSRFYPEHLPAAASTPSEDYILGMASGPPPQRQLFIKCLVRWASKMPLPLILMEGSPGPLHEHYEGTVRCFNHLPTNEMARFISGASLVVARSGYSTLMDLAAFNKPALLVPTPGQWEQEYLAKHLSEQYGFPTATQALNQIPNFNGIKNTWPKNLNFFSKEALEKKLSRMGKMPQGSNL
jgi:CheY-like chemotaxis protein